MHEREYQASLAYAPSKRSDEAVAFFLLHGIPLSRFAHVPSPGEFWARLYRPAVPDHFLVPGEVLEVGSLHFEVVGTPGHTPGHCVLLLRERGLMIVGDHLLPKITPHVGVFPGGPANPLQDFLDSQRRCRDLDAELILPAHGGTYTNHRHRIDQIIQHHEYRMKEMLDVVKRQPHTAYEVAKVAFDFNLEAPLTVQFPATFETLAHLELLRARGAVERQQRGDEIVYSARPSA
jgi:glyoxylase-like metal-dependent hydrolase (beta-lactamase superfamily II)